LAESLSIPRVIVPALPGALSALGILVSDVVKDYSRTVLWRVAEKLPAAQLDREFSTLQKQAAKDFHAGQETIRYQRSVDIRYCGQGYELNLPFTRNLVKEFEREHQRRYGYVHPTREVELVTLRLRATFPTTTTQAGKMDYAGTAHVAKMDHVGTAAPGRPGRAELGSLSTPKAPVLFDGKKLNTAIYSRDTLSPGKTYYGPAIITEYSATTVIPSSKRFRLDPAANLIVTIR
jgi:N-methylhydantoinase A